MSATRDAAPAQRLRSLDVFRGATIALMILVNNAGDWGEDLGAAAPRRLARLDADRPGLPVLPLHRRRGDSLRARPRSALTGRRPARSTRKISRRAAAALPARSRPDLVPLLHRALGAGADLRRSPAHRASSISSRRSPTCTEPRAARDRSPSRLLGGYWAAMKLVPVPGFGARRSLAEGQPRLLASTHLVLGPHIWRYSPGPGDPEGDPLDPPRDRFRPRRHLRRRVPATPGGLERRTRSAAERSPTSPLLALFFSSAASPFRRSSRSTRTSGRRPT